MMLWARRPSLLLHSHDAPLHVYHTLSIRLIIWLSGRSRAQHIYGFNIQHLSSVRLSSHQLSVFFLKNQLPTSITFLSEQISSSRATRQTKFGRLLIIAHMHDILVQDLAVCQRLLLHYF
jgi:hypothetical protein